MIVSETDTATVLVEWAEELLQGAMGFEHAAGFPGAADQLDEVVERVARALKRLDTGLEALAVQAEDSRDAAHLGSCARAIHVTHAAMHAASRTR